MATSKGSVLVYGAHGDITLYTTAGVALTTGAITTIESYDITHEGDVEQIKNGAGVVVAQVSENERLSMSITFIPSAAAGGTGDAQSKLAASLPAINGWATIANAKAITFGGATGTINGDWVYAGGGSVKFTNSGKVMITLPLTKYIGTGAMAGNATVTTLA